ncbi:MULTISPECIES: DUF5630 domain-containing protein [Legionella]|uniref:DUF5630 domain-containing protein n=1 Tax=Legionella TaxID=445 RepID=UPI00096707A7|nr:MULTISPECIES: DUF5630 domain-containing protein [Legionella]MBN9227291.1 DUF5630 domain-containing protein [Legionella steelei]OJW14006.1 MAG: hypothetical protein BGO44_08600 [Legionella sp. 39-23]
MYSFFNFKTFNTSLKLTASDKLFIYVFNQANDEQKHELIKNPGIETITRIAHHNPAFEAFCRRTELTGYWTKIWCSYGAALTQQNSMSSILLFSQPQLNQFDLVRGAHFFYFSQKIRKEINRDFGFSELESLKMAIQYGSVHATQRYNAYIYQQLQQANAKESETLYSKLIANSKLMLPHYGSYGYMVLAEAMAHYCLWLHKNFELKQAKEAYTRVLESLDYAESILKESQYSIHNASLGLGLKCSNSLGFESPSQAKDFFIKYYEKLLESTTESAYARSPK